MEIFSNACWVFVIIFYSSCLLLCQSIIPITFLWIHCKLYHKGHSAIQRGMLGLCPLTSATWSLLDILPFSSCQQDWRTCSFPNPWQTAATGFFSCPRHSQWVWMDRGRGRERIKPPDPERWSKPWETKREGGVRVIMLSARPDRVWPCLPHQLYFHTSPFLLHSVPCKLVLIPSNPPGSFLPQSLCIWCFLFPQTLPG